MYKQLDKLDYFMIVNRNGSIYILSRNYGKKKCSRYWAKLNHLKKQWDIKVSLSEINDLNDAEFSEWFMLIRDKIAMRYIK